MKSRLNLTYLLFFVMSLTLVMSQLAGASQQDFDEVKNLVGRSSSVDHMIAQASESSKDKEPGPIGLLPVELSIRILGKIANQQALEDKSPANLAVVCEKWAAIIRDVKGSAKMNDPLWLALRKDEKNKETYRTFLNGTLVYKFNQNRNDEIIRLKVSDFKDPLKETFDLSQCGETAKYLRITTDPSVFFEFEKVHPKVNILFAPSFWVMGCPAAKTQPFNRIMLTGWNKDEVPVEILWRLSGDDDLNLYNGLNVFTLPGCTTFSGNSYSSTTTLGIMNTQNNVVSAIIEICFSYERNNIY